MSRLSGVMVAALGAAFLVGAAPDQVANLDGRLVDQATGAPVPDGIVTLGNSETRLTPSGIFHVKGALDRVQVRALGYRRTSVTRAELIRAQGVVKLAPFTPKALYLTVYGVGSQNLLGGALTIIRAGGANALVIDLKGDRGLVPYPSAVALAATSGARKLTSVPDLPALVRRFHDAGIYVIGRIVVFKDNPLATAHPELAITRGKGLFRDREGLAWTDPFRAEVRTYNIDLAEEAAKAGVDEIQFDYLRFPDSSAQLALARPSTQANRIAAIAGFLSEARIRLVPYNVFTAADIFGYVCWNSDDTGIGQRLEEIAPQVDYLSPMLYPSGYRWGIPGVKDPVADSYAIVRGSLDEARRRLGGSPRRFRPWLQAFRDYAFDRRSFDANEVATQVRAADDFGSSGWMLWNAKNDYSQTGLMPVPPKR